MDKDLTIQKKRRLEIINELSHTQSNIYKLEGNPMNSMVIQQDMLRALRPIMYMPTTTSIPIMPQHDVLPRIIDLSSSSISSLIGENERMWEMPSTTPVRHPQKIQAKVLQQPSVPPELPSPILINHPPIQQHRRKQENVLQQPLAPPGLPSPTPPIQQHRKVSTQEKDECPICREPVSDNYCTLLCGIHKICRSCIVSWIQHLMKASKSKFAPDVACPVCKSITPSYTICKILPELESPPLFQPEEDAWLEEALQRIQDLENGVELI